MLLLMSLHIQNVVSFIFLKALLYCTQTPLQLNMFKLTHIHVPDKQWNYILQT